MVTATGRIKWQLSENAAYAGRLRCAFRDKDPRMLMRYTHLKAETIAEKLRDIRLSAGPGD